MLRGKLGAQATPNRRRLSRARAEHYLAKYPPKKAEWYFAVEVPEGSDLDAAAEIVAATEIRDRIAEGSEESSPVLDAIRALGVGALWVADDWETHEMRDLLPDDLRQLSDLRNDIRRAVRERIAAWYRRSRTARMPAERKHAAENLRSVGLVLGGGDRRGQHGPKASRYLVRRMYAEQLIRLVRFVRKLAATQRRRLMKEEVVRLAERCRVAPGIIHARYPFSEDGISLGTMRVRETESAVRDWVASELNLEPSTVQNMLSPRASKVPRK